jgi:hypothetical protein
MFSSPCLLHMILVDVCKGCPDARCQQSAPQRMINVRWIVLQAAKGYSILLLLSGSPHRRPRAVKVFQVAERLGVHIAPPLRWLMVPIDVAEGAPQLNPIFPSPPQTLAPFRPGGHANGGMSYARFLGKPTLGNFAVSIPLIAARIARSPRRLLYNRRRPAV